MIKYMSVDVQRDATTHSFDGLLTVHLSIFISVFNQLDAQNFCFTISLFPASTCFETGNKLIVKQKFCTSI